MVNTAVGIVCALASEARHLGPTRKITESLGTLPGGTLVAVTGMGAAAAAAGAQALVRAGAVALASWGMAGGLDPSLKPGAIVLPAEVLGADGVRIPTASGWRERLGSAVEAFAPVRHDRLLTSAKSVGSVADKADLFRTTGAVAVDMESVAIGRVAQQQDIPFIAVRVIVDGAEDVLPEVVTAAADKEGHLQIGRLIGSLALAPGQLAPLIRLAGRYRTANRSLAQIATLMGRVGPGAAAASLERPS